METKLILAIVVGLVILFSSNTNAGQTNGEVKVLMSCSLKEMATTNEYILIQQSWEGLVQKNGTVQTNAGMVLVLMRTNRSSSLSNESSVVAWQGFMALPVALSKSEHNLWVGNLCFDEIDRCMWLVLADRKRFGIYKLLDDGVSNKTWVEKQIPTLMPGLSEEPDSSRNPISPLHDGIKESLPSILTLEIARGGRFLVVTINGKTECRYSTWTGKWSVRKVNTLSELVNTSIFQVLVSVFVVLVVVFILFRLCRRTAKPSDELRPDKRARPGDQ